MRKTTAWISNDGRAYATRAECQLAELEAILTEGIMADKAGVWNLPPDMANTASKICLLKAPQIVNILTTTDRSRPGARKLNGARRKRKTEAEQFPLPINPEAA